MKIRIDALRASFENLGVDGVYLTSRTSHRYFTRFDNEDGALLITKSNAYAFEDFRYIEVATNTLSGAFTVIEPKGKRSEWLGDILKREEVSRLGFEDLSMSVSAYERLKLDVSATLVPVNNTINKMREIKTEDEVLKMEKAQELTDKAFAHILTMLSPNMTENDVASELEYFMRKNGAEDKSFETIAVSGEKSSLPHGVPGNIKLKKGFLTMDFGATVDGYHSDMTRTVSIGKADEEMKKLYNTVLRAQRSALEYLKAGVNTKDADWVAREIIYKDYKGYFGHSLGHSVGLEVHEMPALSPNYNAILVPGNVVTVEPGIYIPGKYGVRIEDMVLICDNGIKNFTKSPKELIEI
ncbi:MAG: aminopeptidase P family protein [Clostridia bacterium]|nr:aminopeptidase P family protein [Clostridia bacterium]